MIKIVTFFLLLAMAVSGSVRAADDWAYSFVPQSPTPNDVLQFRVDFDGCFDYPVHTQVSGMLVEATIYVEDMGCDESNPENFLSPRIRDVGTLDPGSYTARVNICGGPVPPGVPPCTTAFETQLWVVPATDARPATIPASSGVGKAVLAFLFLMLGIEMIRRR